MDYFTHNAGGVNQIRFILRMKNYNVTKWTSSGKDGLWLGLGFGSLVMNGSDIVHCQFIYTNNTSNDKFVCNDRYASGRQLPPLDTTRNTADIATFYS